MGALLLMQVRCPISGEPLRLKQLFPVRFTRADSNDDVSNDIGKKVRSYMRVVFASSADSAFSSPPVPSARKRALEVDLCVARYAGD